MDYLVEREMNNDGSTACGVFLPLPFNLAKDFPDKAAHDDSVPHLTLLYAGDLSPENYKKFCKIVCSVARRIKPFSMELSGYGEFVNGNGQKIPHMKPDLVGSLRLAMLHGILRRAIESELKIEHSYGGKLKKGVPFEAQFKAHATLNYLSAMQAYKGAKPTGSWRVTELECWGHEKMRIPLGMNCVNQPAGLVRSPLTIDYPMAVPEVESGKGDTSDVKIEDKLPGGLADDAKPTEFDPKQLALGIKHEREHTNDDALAREIAADHLKKDPRYYMKLEKLESTCLKRGPISTRYLTRDELRARAQKIELETGLTSREILNQIARKQDLAFQESETSLKGFESHPGSGGSSGDITLDGSLPYLEQQKKIDKLRRAKLKGLK